MYTSSMCKNENAVIKESSEGEKNFKYRGAPQEFDPLKRIYLAWSINLIVFQFLCLFRVSNKGKNKYFFIDSYRVCIL